MNTRVRISFGQTYRTLRKFLNSVKTPGVAFIASKTWTRRGAGPSSRRSVA